MGADMTPYPTSVLLQTEAVVDGLGLATPTPKTAPQRDPRDTPIVWFNVMALSLYHLAGAYFIITVLPYLRWETWCWWFLVSILHGFGGTGGAHRYWTHRSFKAKLPLRIILMLSYCVAGMNSIFDWVRDHRVHHKFTDTDADPHNISRGLFFAHCGWLLRRKHPEVHRHLKQVDMSDILSDPVAMFNRRYHKQLRWLMCFILPTVVPPLCWNETWYYAYAGNIARYVIGLNFVWSVNSFAHLYGTKPFDKKIAPSENKFVSLVAFGEGWHNYHHTFPWDYRTSETGYLNLTKLLLDMFARIGWAYDFKVAPPSLIRRVAERYGDGSHKHWHAPEVPEAAADDISFLDDFLGAHPSSCKDTR